jgi:putative transposase
MRALQSQLRSRKRLLVRDGVAVYHVISRTACRQFLFGPKEKEVFCALLFQQAEFAGIEVLGYCVMSNHIHLLLRVAPVGQLSDELLLGRYAAYYGEGKIPLSTYSVDELRTILAEGADSAALVRSRVLARMGDLPAFMRELKQRFSIWYNHQHENQGTIWGARYKSLIVEDAPESLTRVAAYIDLNPVRAELVSDPKDYRWCGYAAGLAGRGFAREGLVALFGGKRDYSEALQSYRLILFGKGASPKGAAEKDQGVIPSVRLQQVIRAEGRVPVEELLRVRIRYFADGLALGSRGFIEDLVSKNREQFSEKRKLAGTALPEETWGPLSVVRDLRRRVFG